MSDDGNNHGFVDMVARMRVAQRHWFKYKDLKSLELAKTLERDVDRWIDRETGPRARPTLFGRFEKGSWIRTGRCPVLNCYGPFRASLTAREQR